MDSVHFPDYLLAEAATRRRLRGSRGRKPVERTSHDLRAIPHLLAEAATAEAATG